MRDPRRPQELFAAAWQRERKAWDFRESGPGSGVYHSSDGGKSWELMTTEQSGFPTGRGAGRIGLAVSYDPAGKRVVYASIDNYGTREPADDDDEALTKTQLRDMPKEDCCDWNLSARGLPAQQRLSGRTRRQGLYAHALSPATSRRSNWWST